MNNKTFATNRNIELSDEQLERNDEIFNAAFEFCKVLTENQDLEWDMSIIGEIADYSAELLVNHGFQVRFPFVYTDKDGKDEVHEYYDV